MDKEIAVRDQRDGNWSWFQNELYEFFLPIIGREAVHLYQVMTILIPKKIRDPLLIKLNHRSIADYAGMGKGTVGREFEVLHKSGMLPQVDQGPGESPLYVLADLQKLARLGEAEIRRRINAPQWGKVNKRGGADGAQGMGANGPQSSTGSVDERTDGSTPHQTGAAAPTASGENSAPQWGTTQESQPEDEIGEKTSAAEDSLPQKQGVLAPEKGGSCPTAVGQLYKEKNNLNLKRTKTNTAPRAERKEFSKNLSSNSKDPAHKKQLAKQLAAAAQVAMFGHGFTPDRYTEAEIAKAFGRWCEQTGRTPAEAVEFEAKSFRLWLEEASLMFHNWGWRWWFKQGYWATPDRWPYDKQKLKELRERSGASVGSMSNFQQVDPEQYRREQKARITAHLESAAAANRTANLARGAGMTPTELDRLHGPKVRIGEAPEGGGTSEADLEQANVVKQHGDFGPVHEEFYHDDKGAVEQLLADKDGEATGALHHPELGDIDLIYGKEGSAEKQYKDGYGIAKIAVKHPEVIDHLQGLIDGMKLNPEKSNSERARLESKDGQAAVALTWHGKPKKWLLTAFTRGKETSSAAESGNLDGTNRAEPTPTPVGQEADNARKSVAQPGIEGNAEKEISKVEIPKMASPDGMKPYDVARVPLDQLHLDPKRFQYKMNTDAKGVTNLLKGRAWNEDNAGVISVWRDPEDGKTYVVNGHHRYQLAKETGQSDIAVRMIGAGSAEEARSKGAIQNIAEGRGTAMDAAKFFRDTNQTPSDLDRLGVSMGEAKAANGAALAKLHPDLFDQVVNGNVPEGRAVAIGNATSDPAEQEAILKLIDKAEAKGKHVTNDTVNELARMVKGAGQHTQTQETLFGGQEQTHSLALEKAEVSSYIRKQIVLEQHTAAGISSETQAARLAGVEGQNFNTEGNREIADKAAVAKELYDRLSVRSGTVDEILNRASRELADGGKPNDVKARAYADIRDALRAALTGAADEPGGVAGKNEVGPAAGEPGAADARDASDVLDLFSRTPGKDIPKVTSAATLFSRTPGDEKNVGWLHVFPDGTWEIGRTPDGDRTHGICVLQRCKQLHSSFYGARRECGSGHITDGNDKHNSYPDCRSARHLYLHSGGNDHHQQYEYDCRLRCGHHHAIGWGNDNYFASVQDGHCWNWIYGAVWSDGHNRLSLLDCELGVRKKLMDAASIRQLAMPPPSPVSLRARSSWHGPKSNRDSFGNGRVGCRSGLGIKSRHSWPRRTSG